MNLNSILHSSGHINYAAFGLYYGFLRGIFPTLIVNDVYEGIPGLLVARVHSLPVALD